MAQPAQDNQTEAPKSSVSFDVKKALREEMAKQDDGVVSKSKDEVKPTTTEDIKKSIEQTIEKNQEAIE
jgi:hypothetical protein